MNFDQSDELFTTLESGDCTVHDILRILPADLQRAGFDEPYLQANYDAAHSDIFFCSLIPTMTWLAEDDAIQNLMFSYALFDDLWQSIQHKMNVERNKK